MIRRTIRERSDEWLGLPNVQYVGIGRKVYRGRRERRLAVVFFVSRKVASHRLPRGKRIPKRVRLVGPGGRLQNVYVPTDVQIGPRGLRATAERRGGSRIKGRGSTRGRIGFAYQSKMGRLLFLTNAHVAARLGRRDVGEPVRRYPGSVRVGVVFRTTEIKPAEVNTMDASAVELVDDGAELYCVHGERNRIVGLGSLRSEAETEVFFVNHNGHRRRFSRPVPIETPMPVTIDGVDVEFRSFLLLEAASGSEAVPGDSGSVLLRESNRGLVACGLLFAGEGQRVGVLRIHDAFRRLSSKTASDGEAENVWPLF